MIDCSVLLVALVAIVVLLMIRRHPIATQQEVDDLLREMDEEMESSRLDWERIRKTYNIKEGE